MAHRARAGRRPPMDKAPGDGGVALAVDLDGTLLKTDMLVESALELLSHQPWRLLWFPFWLMRGKAHLKREIARRVELDVASMPWDARVLDLVREQSGQR